MSSVQCHICSQMNETKAGECSVCEMCGADLTNANAEKVLLMEWRTASFAKGDKLSDVRVDASAYLTDKRLVVVPLKLRGVSLSGMFAAAMSNKLAGKYGAVSLPFDQIKSVRDGRFGLLVSAIILDTIDGELLKMTVRNREEWKEAITKQWQKQIGR